MGQFSMTILAVAGSNLSGNQHAEVTSVGALATVGLYASDFASGGDVQLAYGESECSQFGMASSFTVRANVAASCTVSVSNMDFGGIDADLVRPVDQTATISLSCTNGSSYNVGLDMGAQPEHLGPDGRRMTNGVNVLAYGLYRDAAASAGWGTEPGNVAAGIGTGGNQSLTVFGRIFPQ